MNTIALTESRAPRWRIRRIFSECMRRQRSLTVFGFALALALVPAVLAFAVDPRTLHGASVWLKPMKFMASVSLFALMTAWFVGLLPEPVRRGRATRDSVRIIIAFGSAAIACVLAQAVTGTVLFHGHFEAVPLALYAAMGIGGLAIVIRA